MLHTANFPQNVKLIIRQYQYQHRPYLSSTVNISHLNLSWSLPLTSLSWSWNKQVLTELPQVQGLVPCCWGAEVPSSRSLKRDFLENKNHRETDTKEIELIYFAPVEEDETYKRVGNAPLKVWIWLLKET